MADVFLVLARGPERVDRLAVLKQLRHPEDVELAQMFLDEARLTVRLNHPNIVHTYEVGESKGAYYITMEYLEGQPLSEVMAALSDRGEGLSEACVASIAVQALKGLHYAHEFCDFDGTPLGIVHRDVSPHNLHVTYTGEVKVLDFGIAKAVLNSTRTESGILKGKVRYMSPEQAASKDVDRRADLFSFGVVLWEMLARRPLFTGDAISVLTQLATRDIPPLRDLRPEISPAVEAVVRKALARDPAARYATAEEMRLDIQRVFQRGEEDSGAVLARVMTDLFESKRDALRSQIRLHLAKPGSLDDSSSNLKAHLPTLIEARAETGASLQALTTGQRRHRRPMWRVLGGVGAGLALALVIGAMLVKKKKADAPAAVVSAPSVSSTALAPKLAHLHLETAPPGAFVEWEGQRFGPTPIELSLEPGSQRLVITHDGYETAVLSVNAQPGEAFARGVTLQAAASGAPSGRPSAAMASASHTGTRDGVPRPSRAPAASSAPPAPSSSAPQLNVRMIDDEEGK